MTGMPTSQVLSVYFSADVGFSAGPIGNASFFELVVSENDAAPTPVAQYFSRNTSGSVTDTGAPVPG